MPKVNRKDERAERFARYCAAGVPAGTAIQLALSPDPNDRKATSRAIPDFAARHRINPKLASHAIYGGRKPTDDLCVALAKELGGKADTWRSLLTAPRGQGRAAS